MACAHSVAKFQDEITHYLWELSLDSGHDQEAGESESMGWYALFDGPVVESDTTLSDIVSRGEGYGSLRVWDAAEMMNCAGAILEQHSSGAVYSTLYNNTADMQAAWAAIEEEYAVISEDNA